MVKVKNLLTLDEINSNDLSEILRLAAVMKFERRRGIRKRLLEGRSLALILQKPSTRTRVSFEAAMTELGGHAITLDTNMLQLVRGETIEDTSRTISSYVDAVAARMTKHKELENFAAASRVPVFNCLSNNFHPCQTLADLHTVIEEKGSSNDVKVAWIGDGTNVCNSLLVGFSKMGFNLVIATPPNHEPLKSAVNIALKNCKKNGSNISFTNDPSQAVEMADAVFTDSFVSMGLENERRKRLRTFIPKYQINTKLMKRAKKDAIFLHCLPAHRGAEVTDEVIDGSQSRVWQVAENRIHTQKALLCYFLLNRKAINDLI